MNKSVSLLLSKAISELADFGVESSNFELRMLLAEVLEVSLSDVRFADISLTPVQEQKFWTMIDQRKAHVPADKIIGRRGFYKYDFVVDTNVLSPRPDTEILLEEALNLSTTHKMNSVLELGVGSGCIITSILAEKYNMYGTGVDISLAALKVAEQNAKNIMVSDRLELIQGDWFADNFLSLFEKKYDLIVSNPPYIPTSEISKLDLEVQKYDPILALDGGEDGLDSYRRLAKITPQLLNPNGYILLEVGENQAEDVAQIFMLNGFYMQQTLLDLNNIKRCVVLKK